MPTAVIIGGGAAGFFAAIPCAEVNVEHPVIVPRAPQERPEESPG